MSSAGATTATDSLGLDPTPPWATAPTRWATTSRHWPSASRRSTCPPGRIMHARYCSMAPSSAGDTTTTGSSGSVIPAQGHPLRRSTLAQAWSRRTSRRAPKRHASSWCPGRSSAGAVITAASSETPAAEAMPITSATKPARPGTHSHSSISGPIGPRSRCRSTPTPPAQP